MASTPVVLKRTWATFWIALGVGMLVAGFWVDWFRFNVYFTHLSVGWLALIYGVLGAYYNHQLNERLKLNEREMHDWGDRLERATPKIVAWTRAGLTPKAVAQEVEKEEGVPYFVTLKYMLALSHHSPKLLARDKGSEKVEPEAHHKESKGRKKA